MTAPQDVFSSPAPRLFTIPPASRFLKILADTLSQAVGLADNPAALAETLVYTPNRRAARALAQAFHESALSCGHGALISPDIRVLGDLEEDTTIAPMGASELDLAPPLPVAKRRGSLARLVQAWRAAENELPLPPSSALAAADELGRVLDQAALSDNASWDQLEQAVQESDLAQHWKISARFLSIVATAWPAHLKELEASDPMSRRVAAARTLAKRWETEPPEHPVIIAGSTGATPATRLLMRAAMSLPKGAVVFPGLDPDADNRGWDAIASSPSHPQFTLKRALNWLKVDRGDVSVWPGAEERPVDKARRKLVNEALAPAVATRDWTQRLDRLAAPNTANQLVRDGLSGLSLVEAEDENEEALCAALLLRETLETPQRTAALVTPDPGLARRVSALLKRWGINIQPSAGTPFMQTSQGSCLGLVFEWLKDTGNIAELLALLKHPLTRLGLEEEAKTAALRELETHPSEFRNEGYIRGPRRHRDLADLSTRLANQDRFLAADLISRLDEISTLPELDADTLLDGAEISETIARFVEELNAPANPTEDSEFWSGPAGAQAARCLEDFAELCTAYGPINGDLWSELAAAFAAELNVPLRLGEHPRLAIWGPLEARLQTCDLIILGSLNEGSWPVPAAADGFLPRRLRKEFGLPDPEERLGLSAHDFAQLAAMPEVVLLRSKRVDDKPAVASRWIWRLQTLASGGLDGRDAVKEAFAPLPGNNPVKWAASLREAKPAEPRRAPEPRPPLHARPKQFSVSRVTRLIRDPYSVYAQDILKLRPLSYPGAPMTAGLTGTAIHTAIEVCENNNNLKNLSTVITDTLVEAGADASLIALQQPLWNRAADFYLSWRQSRSNRVKNAWLEEEGKLKVYLEDVYTLTGKADRIELLDDGSLAIIDFKTGQPKSRKMVESGLEPQLTLEAYIASQGGYTNVPAKPTAQIIYVSMAQGSSILKPTNGKPLDISPMDEAVKAFQGFEKLVTAYRDETQAYRSKPRVEFVWNVSDYDRLARRAEWTTDDAAGDS